MEQQADFEEIKSNTDGNPSVLPKRKSGFAKKKRYDYIFVFLCLLYPIGLWAFFFFSTNTLSLVMAFQKISYDGTRTFNGLNNFVDFISEMKRQGGYLHYGFINTFKNYLIPLFICMPLTIIFSYYIFKRTKGSRFVQTVSLIPSLIPGMVIALVFKRFVETALPSIAVNLGIDNLPKFFSDPKYTYGTTLFYSIWLSFSSGLILYPNAMNAIQQEIFESASIDGVDNIFSELWHIVLPLIFPTMETFLITGFAGFMGASGPLLTFWLYNAPMETYDVGYYFYLQTFRASNEMGYPMLAAGGLLMTLVIAPLTYLLRHCLDKYGPKTE